MTPGQIKRNYQLGRLSKPEFITQMYELHQFLFAYSDFLKATDITHIRIEPSGVVIRLDQPPIEMWCALGDTRAAPIEALNFGHYERCEFSLLQTMIRALKCESPVFFDIGANAGFYSIGLSKTISGLRAFAFEPIPKTFEILQRNLTLNGLDGVKTFNLGLSNKEDTVTFYTYPSQSAASSEVMLLNNSDACEVQCRLRRLDSVIRELPAVDVIKCDVEGAELFVFEGALETLKACKPVILSEMLRKWCAKFDYHPNAIIELLGGIGYLCYKIRGPRLERCQEVTNETNETNFIFVPEEKRQAVSELA